MTVAEDFAKETALHEMTIELDQGVHRSIKFSSTGEHPYINWFRIVTWPGCLAISGDCGTYVFERLPDMFEFFRGHIPDPHYYWKQKVIAIDRTDGLMVFDPARLEERVKEDFASWMEDTTLSKEQQDEVWEAIQDDVLGAEDTRDAHERMNRFEFEIDGHEFRFTDSWEYNLEKPSQRFEWNCLAIEWAIKKYDEHKANAVKVPSTSKPSENP